MESTDSLVAKVKELQRQGADAKEAWAMYTSAHGGGTKDPAKHTAEFLQGFIATYESGQLIGATDAGPSAFGGDSSPEYLVGKVKELQRSDQRAKEQWCLYTDLNGAGTRDPSKHTPEFLQGFLDHFASGHMIMPGATPAGMENPNLADAFKNMQKKSSTFKDCWEKFCATQGGGRYDPLKHDTTFHFAFLDNVASLALGGTGTTWPTGIEENPAKRMRDSSGMGMGMGGSGNSAKDKLVHRLKAYQRASAENKELWSLYADTYLGGVRDPARHDASTLEEFCVNHEVPEYAGASGIGGMSASMGPSPGMRPSPQGPSWLTGSMPGMGDSDPTKDALVIRIKTFQKVSRDNAELWRGFCGQTKDPSRHTNEKLQEFCKIYGVP